MNKKTRIGLVALVTVILVMGIAITAQAISPVSPMCVSFSGWLPPVSNQQHLENQINMTPIQIILRTSPYFHSRLTTILKE